MNKVKKPKGTKLALVRFSVVEDAQRALEAIPKEKVMCSLLLILVLRFSLSEILRPFLMRLKSEMGLWT